MNNDFICLGIITSPHGIKGHVKIKTFTENPENFTSYGELTDGITTYNINTIQVTSKNTVIAKIKDITSRTQADLLRNKKLFIEKTKLPDLIENEFYYNDLVGLQVLLEDNNIFGSIKKIHNFGSCDIIEILLYKSKKSTMLPFTKNIFTHVNTKERYVVLKLPEIIGNNSGI
ncbi:16S rRNA processing protein RimM [Ehrlichia ruminantium]|uniref:Ribosome maturation factor RimM n=1 Tax=Ehrlichia ruminantium TaxID=779 RepID=A0AAE6QBF1_EHRRU|nr:ribosome maturation factor RimM [Ehrlichia ruminantium]QGR02948.1 16S rRNA processing protein RimM [Ehrlichia ruminantium]QGR03873.1 16S rRNA processing protein RimM [Ehrlichia ruminantium]QGR04799.1 16S rRNA processing protein RimM [Ehrlichia ruminantium]